MIASNYTAMAYNYSVMLGRFVDSVIHVNLWEGLSRTFFQILAFQSAVIAITFLAQVAREHMHFQSAITPPEESETRFYTFSHGS
jgi:hypothetical protein